LKARAIRLIVKLAIIELIALRSAAKGLI